jgi:hypothetical protein
MSAPTEAHREVAVAIFAIAMKSAHHGAPFREPCAQLIADSEARATAELRDSLALEQDMGNAACDELRGDADELRADVVRLTARAERAEAELARLARPCGWPHCEPVKADHAELATEREKAERYRLVTLKLDAELATERARLDWLESDAGVDWQWSSSALTIRRAVIDAAMKEGAK